MQYPDEVGTNSSARTSTLWGRCMIPALDKKHRDEQVQKDFTTSFFISDKL